MGQLEELPWGARHREFGGEVIAVAQERDDEDLEFAARMRLTTDGVMTGHSDLALTNFSWCAAKHRENPARFIGGDEEADSFFWQYKWMPGLLRKSPVFERAQIMDILDDFEDTYRAAGLPLSAVVTARFETAVHMGELAEAQVRAAELEKMPQDPYSSCDACIPSDYVDLELLRGDLAAAADRAVGMWRAGAVCGEEPESALAGVLVALAKLGRSADAAEAFEFSYGQSKGNPDNLANVALCATFASITGNHALALAIVERHLTWLAHDPLGEADHFTAASGFAVVLNRLADTPDGMHTLVRGSDDARLEALLPHTDHLLTAPELAVALWEVASELANRFDARNQTDLYARTLADSRELVNTNLPIELDHKDAFAPVLIRQAQPSTPEEWLARALDTLWSMDNEGAFEAAMRAVDGLTGVQLTRAYAVCASAANRMENVALTDQAYAGYIDAVAATFGEASAALARSAHPDGDTKELRKAIAKAEKVGGIAPPVLVRALGLVAIHLLESEGRASRKVTAEALEFLDRGLAAASDEQLAKVPADVRADTLLNRVTLNFARAQVLFAHEDLEGALAALDGAQRDAATRTPLAVVAELRARMIGAAGDYAGSAQQFDTAASLYAATGFPRVALTATLGAAKAFVDAEDPHSAVQRYDYAASLVPPGGELPVGARWDFAGALVDADEPDLAVPLLERILSDELSAGIDGRSLGQTYLMLGRAYDQSYDDRAAEHYLRAAQLFASSDDIAPSAHAYLMAGREFSYQRDFPRAAEALEGGLGMLASSPAAALEFDLLTAQGPVLAEVGGDWDAAMERAARIAGQLEDADRLRHALKLRVALNMEYGDPARVIDLAPAAIEASLKSDGGGDAIGVLWWLTQAHVRLEQPDAAVAALDTYGDRLAEFGEDEREVLKDMGVDVLKDLGRKREAKRWKGRF